MMILLALFGVNIYQILGDAIIGNGYVILGVNENGALNVPYVGGSFDLPASDPIRHGEIGLRTHGGGYAATEAGCLCEGWGVGVPGLNYRTYANQAFSPGSSNTDPKSQTTSADSSSTTVVTESYDGNIRVTHEFEPSPDSIYAFQGTVTIKNIGGSIWPSVIYRRVMDWDISPTEFSEYVTIIGTDAAMHKFSSDDGFCSPDPLGSDTCNELSSGTTNVDFVDSGPNDHGAVFDFEFNTANDPDRFPLNPGEEVTFKIYYGVAPGELRAEQALNDIGAEIASLGQNSGATAAGPGHITGLPYTFFFGFGDVGGTVIDPDCDTAVPYNVMFVMDESGSIGSSGYTNSKEFIKNLIERDISEDAKVAIFEYSTNVDVIHLFNEPQKPRTHMLAALAAATFDASGTNHGAAIQEATEEYERADAAGDLAEGDKILFFMTDGYGSGCPCCFKARLDALGVRVYILGVNGFSTTSIECLVDPSRRSTDIIDIDNFSGDAFAAVEDTLRETLCPEDLVVPPEPLTCAEAQRYCKEVVGTSLASITSDSDRADAISVLTAAGESYGWIGLYSDDVETYWQFRSGSECPSDSAYKCVDFWCTAPGGDALRPRCIGPSEGGFQCAVFYNPDPDNGKPDDCVDNDAPTEAILPFLCDAPPSSPLRRRLRR